MSRTYLVTGGAGFIGSHLCDGLLAAGHRVRVLDDLSTGKRHNLNDAVDLMIGNVANPDAVTLAADGADGIFHLAAVASVARSTEAWLDTHQINLDGTINVFEAARAIGAPVVYASSAAVYGDNRSLPLAEDAPLAPLTPYGADKAGCELHGRAAWHVFGVPNTGLRFFNVYGPRQDPSSPYSGVISIFTDRILAGQRVTVFGDGEQTRDFVFVDDVARVLRAAMDSCAVGARVVNVCSGKSTSLNALIAALEALTGRRARVGHDAPRAGDIRDSLGDPARLQRDLDIASWTPFTDGLAQLVSWWREPAAAA